MSLKIEIAPTPPINPKQFNLSITATLPDQGLCIIFGESGSGKTSLLRSMAGLDRNPNTLITFRDTVWQDRSQFLPTHKRNLAYVFQEPSLFEHLSVQGNLDFARKRASKPLDNKEQKKLIDLLGIGALLDRSSQTLSGGEKQRVAICRAMFSQPDLLLMDEPLSALDEARKREILPYIENLKNDTSIPILYVTHSIQEVMRLADSIVVLENGEASFYPQLEDAVNQGKLLINDLEGPSVILEGKLGVSDDQWQLAKFETNDLCLSIASRNEAPIDKARIRIFAKDVSLTLEASCASSIQNILRAKVISVSEPNRTHSLVKLGIGDQEVLSQVTRKSVQELNIAPGKEIYAQIKSVAILS